MNRNKLNMQVYMTCFDQNEYNAKIAEFCRESSIDDTVKRNIELAFEELVKNNIAEFIAHNDDRGLPIEVTVEHYGTDSNAEMTIIYGGSRYDPVYDGDELSALLARKLFSSIKYSYNSLNRLDIRFD